MGGLYDILESYRQKNDPRFIYDGLYQDPLYDIATANPLKAMSPGYEYMNQDAINRYLKEGASDMSGNVPADYDRAIDFKRYFEDRPLKTLDYGNRFQDFKPRVGFPYTPTSDIKPPLNMNRFQGVSDMSVIDETINDEQDQDYIDAVDENKENGIMKILRNLPTFGNLAAKILPQEDPRATNMRNFYGNQYGLTSSGSIASGIMKGYNPVYGNDFLNKISGGIIPAGGYGLAGAMERRINNILGRRRPQTDASRAKIAELRNLQLADMTERANKGESLSSIGKSTFSGPGMAFAPQTNTYTGGKTVKSSSTPGGYYSSPK